MCLGIPGQIVAITTRAHKLAMVDVQRRAARRSTSPASSTSAHPVESCVGDWVLVHVGFAMSRIDEAEAAADARRCCRAAARRRPSSRRCASRAAGVRRRERTTSALAGLYPFLTAIGTRPSGWTQALLASVRQKAADSVAVKQRFFAEQRRGRGARRRTLLARCYRAGGRLFTMGNGGSSCDAAHLAVEFQHPVTAGRPALPAVNLSRTWR